MQKVNYSDFSDKNVVSSLQRTLYLDKDQFEGLPKGEIELKDVKISKIKPDEGNTLENIKYYKFSALDIAQIRSVEKVASALPENVKKQVLSNIPRVYFRVVLNGGSAENAQNLFNFITSHNLDESVNGITLSGIDWKVIWCYEDSYHDVLTLVIDNFDKVKLSAK